MVGLPARCAAGLGVAQMRTVRGWLWFGLAFALILAAGASRAETINATSSGTATVLKYVYSSKIYSTGAAVCAAINASNSDYYGFVWATNSSYPNGYCQATKNYPFSGWGNGVSQAMRCDGPDGAAETGATPCAPIYSCPAGQNWTLSGTQCTRPDCVAPQVRNQATGVCEMTCPAAGSNAMIGGAQAWGITGTSSTCTTGIAYGGCKITCTAGVSASGKASCTGCTFTGELSIPGDVAADPTTGEEIKTPTKPEECLAKGMGYVTTSSGTTCVAQDQAVEPISTKTTETTVKKDGAGVTTGTEETTVECIGDKCTKTTTTKDGSGLTTGTTASTGTGDKSGTDPTKDKPSECDKHPETIGCSQYGTPVEDGPLTSNAVGTSSLTPSLSSSGTCPADINLPKGMKFSWEYVCMYASGIRPVIIALAWLSAGFLLFGMRLD